MAIAVECPDIRMLINEPWLPLPGTRSIKARCLRHKGFLIMIALVQGERIVASLKPVERVDDEWRVMDAELYKEWLEELLEGRVPFFHSSCTVNPGRPYRIRVYSKGARSLGLIIHARERLFAKVMRRAEQDNLEPLMLAYLSENAPGLAPKPYCTVFLNEGKPYLILMEDVGGEEAAKIYLGKAAESIRGGDAAPIREGLIIGKAAARMHKALLSCREEWCRPEEASSRDLASWIHRLRVRASTILRLSRDSLASQASHAILEIAGRLEEELSPPWGTVKARIHGDLHLGQIRVKKNTAVITDFEGEPYKHPASRLEKETPERDLACLARSIDYAFRLGAGGERWREGLLKPSETMKLWEQEAFEAVLKGYMMLRGLTLSPEMLRLWLAERASYEAVYELRFHTGLHPIPMAALIRMWRGDDPLLSMVEKLD